jgi:hypothetical protein
VRRETGKEYVVKVHCDEGVATHISPEPGVREAKAERTISEFSALAEERAKPWWRRIVG